MQIQNFEDRRASGNSTYTQGGVTFSADTFVGIESSVLRINFCGNLPALRVAANRWWQV
jgi:hypothetical protein